MQTRQTIRTEGNPFRAVQQLVLFFLLVVLDFSSQLTMSDSDGDIDDELLALAGATEKKRKRQASGSKQSGHKKRKASASDSDSENVPESEEGQEANPFPLDGKYEDDADRERLLGMSEIARENILAERLEQMQKIQDRRKLQEMIKQQKNGSGDADTVAKAAKRQHAVRGATKEKSRKLDELKARRKAKDEKKRTQDSPKRDRSSSPMDMDTSSGEEEDGQITKYEEEEEKDRKLFSKQPNPDDEPITLGDLSSCRLTRDMLAKHCMAPWFEDYVKGGWVRYLIGQERNEPVYRLCEVTNLGANLVRPYKINERTVNQLLELKHGKSVKTFYMDKVSNAAFDAKEFDRLGKTYAVEEVRLPSKRQLGKKAAQLHKLATQPMTEVWASPVIAKHGAEVSFRMTLQ
jgi:RNA polymerase-associated protein RTF1